MFLASLYIALFVFGFGLIYKMSTWFRYSLTMEAGNITFTKRISSAARGILLNLLSRNILTFLKVFVIDVLIQIRILRESIIRWIMHMCIFGGFMLLFLMHALDKFITIPLFTDYYSTLNPFLFLRNLFAALVVFGLLLAVYRRFILKAPRRFSNAMDKYTLIILAVIMVSGILLEGTKIVSFSRYQSMVQDYSDLESDEEYNALESYWVKDFGVVSPTLKEPFDKNILLQGRELHETSCAECHSRPHWAFMSYGTAKIIKPIAKGLDRADISTILWYIHFLASFIGLAYLPFSKMFHVFTSPLSLLANAVMDKEKSDPANIATRQIMELDACTHCGACSLRCAVGVMFEEIANINILPSEKINSIKTLAAGKTLTDRELSIIQEGLYLCTNCQRCTVVCPVGINLQELWFNVRETMLEKGYPESLIPSPLSFYRGLLSDNMMEDHYIKPVQLIKNKIADEFKLTNVQNNTLNNLHMNKRLKNKLGMSAQGNTFSYCFNCRTCTLSCPVVDNFDNQGNVLGLEPHRIIHATILGLDDLIFSSKMLWTCLGCYECQENCPQGVRVTDVFYELKNFAIRYLQGKPPTL